MGNSKVIFGNETLIDLTGDTVTSDTLLAGTTAHNRSGEQIVGTATVPEELDDLTDVDLTSPAEGDLLQYDATEQKWVNSAVIPQKVAGLQKTGCVNIVNCTANSAVQQGITFTRNADGTYLLNGTNNSGSTCLFDLTGYYSEYLKNNTTYRLVGCPAGGGSDTYRLTLNNLTVDVGNGVTFTTPASWQSGVSYRFFIAVSDGVTVNNLLFKPMITTDLSATYDDYQPYSMTNRELTEVAEKAITVDKNWAFTGEYSTLTENTQFTCPEDGYLYCEMPKQSTGEARLIYDGNNGLFSETVLPSSDMFFKRVIFLRKGLKIKYVASGATPTRVRFYSIV